MTTSASPTGRPEPRRWVALAALLALVATLLALWLRPGAREQPPADLAWALEHEATPTELFVGVDVEVPVRIRNLGVEPWSPQTRDRLAYHWRDEAGELLVRDGLRTELPGEIGPGELLEARARVQPPDEPGRYQLEWAIVREDVTWYPPPEGGPRFHPVEVVVGELAWTLVRGPELPESLTAGETIITSVRVRNTGDPVWDPAHGDALAFHWWTDEGGLIDYDGRRTPLPSRVEAGEEVELGIVLVTPRLSSSEPRRLCVEVEPLREGVRWFGSAEQSLDCALVEPDPRGWALLAATTPTTLAVDSPAQPARVVLLNTGTEPWPPELALGYRWTAPTGLRTDGPRIGLPSMIEPGEQIELDALVEPPPGPGRHTLTWGLVLEGGDEDPSRGVGVGWYPRPDDPASASQTVEVTRKRLAWALVRAEPLAQVWVNRTTTVEVELRNLGTEPWSEATGDHLAYHWLDADGEVVEQDGLRTGFDHAIAPGEAVVVTAKLRGPDRPGEYRLQWELVREHERWFGAPVGARAGGGLSWGSDELAGTTRARWRIVPIFVVLALASVLGAVGVRRRITAVGLAEMSARTRTLVEALPLVWAALASLALVSAFHELSGIEAWSSAWWVEASGVWIVVAALALARHRTRAWLGVALVAFLAALGLADLVYMHYFGSIVPIVALTASHHLGEVGDSAVAELDRAWAWLGVVPLAGVIAAAIWPLTHVTAAPAAAPESSEPAPTWWLALRPRLIAAGACLALATPATIQLGLALAGELGQRVFSEQGIVGRFGYLNAHLFDLARYLRERGRRGKPSEAALAELQAWFAARAETVAAITTASASVDGPERIPFAAAQGHNLLLIQVEALQTWVIGLEVGGQEVTPLLNRMRAEADWYPYLVDQTNQGKTSDAEYATLGSQHPLGEGAVCFLRADNQFFTLAHVLQDRGYATLSAHPYKRGFWNRAVLHPRYGFTRSLFRRELGPGQETGWGLADGLFFERMVPHLRELPQPWFAFLITLSLHHPYDEFPDNLDSLDVGALEGTRVGNYLEAMHYFDRSLAQLLADLDAAGLLDHTVVALYGDHDARFELDEYPEVLELAGLDGWDPGAFARLERVPLFVRVPASVRAPAGEVLEVGGHVDIAPTLLHSLGLDRPVAWVGRALVPSEDGGFAAYPDGSAYSRERMYVATGKGIPREGGCFEFPDGGSRPLAECAGLRDRAAEELEVSRRVVDFDLHRVLGTDSP